VGSNPTPTASLSGRRLARPVDLPDTSVMRNTSVAGTCALVLVALCSCWRHDASGPLAWDTASISSVSVPGDVGQAKSFGIDLPRNTGTEPAVLDAIRPSSPTEGLRIVGYRVIVGSENGGQGGVGAVDGYPPADYLLHDVKGWFDSSGRNDAMIVVGMEATRAGMVGAPAWVLTYHVGSHSYTATYLQGAWICAPAARYRHCPAAPGFHE
jgi:hypothetical protein